MTAKRLMVLSLVLSVVGIAILLLGQTNSLTAAPQVSRSGEVSNPSFTKVLVAKQAIKVGQPYTLNMFKWQSTSDSDLANYLDFITQDKFERLDLKAGIAYMPIRTGQIMSAADFERPEGGVSMAYSVQAGYRAISVPVDETTANSGFVQPGDKVDILMLGSQVGELKQYDNLAGSLYVTTIAKNVRVLAFNDLASSENFQEQRSSYGADLPDNSSVSLEVTPEQATQIVLANQIGKLTLSLRGAEETDTDLAQPFTVTSKLINPESQLVEPNVGLIQLRANSVKSK